MHSLPPALAALRPEQLAKNALVPAGVFFALADRTQPDVDPRRAVLRALAATAVFAVASGAVYLLNDVHDAARDRLHPEKRDRPVASGALGRTAALAESAALAAAALSASLPLGRPFALVLGGYLALQAAYTFALKRVPVLDVACIAAGFALRVRGGIAAAGVECTGAILACTACGAAFLAIGKRRAEAVRFADPAAAAAHRPVLRFYPRPVLDAALVLAATATLAVYAGWALSPATADRFGAVAPALGAVPVAAGLVRYVWLVLRRGEGGRPERTLLRDRFLLAAILLYLLLGRFSLVSPFALW